MQPPVELIDRLVAAYAEPHRAYHTMRHISECFDHLDACPVRALDPLSLELALWFHDAVYDTRASDNEERSAAWARSALRSLPTATLRRIEGLILVTRHEGAPSTPDEQLLVDIDLSILGAPTDRFEEYELQVRQEYAWVPDDAYRQARARILTQFERRTSLYHTGHFRALLEDRARCNLRRSLEALAA